MLFELPGIFPERFFDIFQESVLSRFFMVYFDLNDPIISVSICSTFRIVISFLPSLTMQKSPTSLLNSMKSSNFTLIISTFSNDAFLNEHSLKSTERNLELIILTLLKLQ